jgi:cholest-4-en-3-one 26-monooxygenase
MKIDLYNRDNYVASVPFEMFDHLRANQPVWWQDEPDGPGFWCFTRYDDVVEVNRDWERFSSHKGGTMVMEMDADSLAMQQQMMLNMDPPLHTRYRLLINKGFTPRMVKQLEDSMRDRATRIVDAICEKGECDFVTDVAAELPLQVIADILGVPQEDRFKVFEWSNRLVGADDPEYAVLNAENPIEAAMELYSYGHAIAEERRLNPQDDIVSILLKAEVEGHQLTELEFDMFFLLLTVAGNETTRNALAHGMLALMQHPEQRQKLIDDPSLMDTAVEEILRWGSPVMCFRRTATKDTEVGGQAIKEGDKVVVWYISANRDESVFEDPYTFDITRSQNPHVSFGSGGPHFCLGANLARMEMKIMYEEILRRLPDMELAGEVERLKSHFINGIKHLPVKFTPKPKVAANAA